MKNIVQPFLHRCQNCRTIENTVTPPSGCSMLSSARHRRQYRSEGGGGGRASGQLPIKMFNRIDWEEVLSINNHFTLLVEDPWHEAGPGPGDAADCNQDFFLVTTFMFPAFLWLVSPPPSGSTRSTANIGSVLGKGNFLTIKTCSRRWTWRASLEPHHHHVVK